MKTAVKKVIIHVDMDAFFASVEQLLHPEWRGKPVIVGANPRGGKGRGVVSTASYEARKFGVHSAMPISRAYRLCPEGIYVLPHAKLYRQYSRQIFEILSRFTPLIQPVSIDEAFMEVSGSVHLFASAEALAREIKQTILKETGLTASIGVAPNKSIAKIASDFHKPDGLTIVTDENVREFLDPLPVTRLWGVGAKTRETLLQMGIHTVAELRCYPPELLRASLGQLADHLLRLARGEDDREVVASEPIKSVSHEITFEEDCDDWQEIEDALLHLAEKVGYRMRKYQVSGRTIQLKIRFQDFKTYTRSRTLQQSTQLAAEIFPVGKDLLKSFRRHRKAVRLIGIGVSNLVDEKAGQLSLWEDEKGRKLRLEKVMDQIQEKYGPGTLKPAQILQRKSPPKERK